MPKIPYGKYTKEFRAEAVKLVTAHGHSIDDAALRISVPKSTLANWVRAYNAGQLSQIGKNYKGKSESDLEIARLKRELAEVKMEIILHAQVTNILSAIGYKQSNCLHHHYGSGPPRPK